MPLKIKTEDRLVVAKIINQQGNASLQDLVEAEITKVQGRIRRLKSVIGRNRLNAFMTGGNHDHSLVEAGQYFNQPSWTIEALGYQQAGINYVDYGKVHKWGGFQFSHRNTANFDQSGIIVHGHTHQLHVGYDRVCPGVFTEWAPHVEASRPPWRGLVLD
jgi:hypothetical protein